MKMENNEAAERMKFIRSSIDEIDRQVVKLFAKRYGFVKEASKYKKSSKDVIAEDRIKDVLNKVRKTAEEEKIDPDLIEKIYDFIVHSFISFEMSEFEQRKNKEK